MILAGIVLFLVILILILRCMLLIVKAFFDEIFMNEANLNNVTIELEPSQHADVGAHLELWQYISLEFPPIKSAWRKQAVIETNL